MPLTRWRPTSTPRGWGQWATECERHGLRQPRSRVLTPRMDTLGQALAAYAQRIQDQLCRTDFAVGVPS